MTSDKKEQLFCYFFSFSVKLYKQVVRCVDYFLLKCITNYDQTSGTRSLRCEWLPGYSLEYQGSVWNLQKKALFVKFYPDMSYNDTFLEKGTFLPSVTRGNVRPPDAEFFWIVPLLHNLIKQPI